MKNTAIEVAIANMHGAVDLKNEVIPFIECNSSDVEIYERTSVPYGSIQNSAFDVMMLLNATGSAASLAALLWMAYDRFVAPRKKDNENGGIVLRLTKEDGTSDMFWIGNTDDCREVFVEDFSHKVDRVRGTTAAGKSSEHLIEETHIGSMWVRRR